MILLGGYVGLRAGEVGGLRTKDIDAERCRITVAQAVVRTRSGLSLGQPKTEKSRRPLTILCSLSEEIVAFTKDNPPAADGRIFHKDGGGMIDHIYLTKLSQRVGSVSFHELRHACASLLIDSGANPRAIQVYLGHSDLRTTLQTYGHLFDQGGDALADSMQARRDAHRNGSQDTR
jgi:integrase